MQAHFRPVSSRLLNSWRADPSIALQQAIVGYGVEEYPIEQDFERSKDHFMAQVEMLPNLLPPEMMRQFPDDVLEQLRGGVQAAFERVSDQHNAVKPPVRKATLDQLGLDASDFGSLLDLGQVWDVLHYGLTGHTTPVQGAVGQSIFGGEELGAELGYGPIRFLTAEAVVEVCLALEAVDESVVRTRLELAPNDRLPYAYDPGPHLAEWALTGLGQLRHHYRAAADSGRAMLLYIV